MSTYKEWEKAIKDFKVGGKEPSSEYMDYFDFLDTYFSRISDEVFSVTGSNAWHIFKLIEKVEKDNTKLRTKVEANIPVERIKGIQDEIDKSFKAHIDNQLKSTDSLFPPIENHNALKAEVEELKKRINLIDTSVLMDEDGNQVAGGVIGSLTVLEKKVAELEKRPDLEEISMVGYGDFPLMGLKEILQHIFKNIEHTK